MAAIVREAAEEAKNAIDPNGMLITIRTILVYFTNYIQVIYKLYSSHHL
jgi:hypothetical protein